MEDSFVFEFTADVEFTPLPAEEVALLDVPLAELSAEQQAEAGLPMDAAQYPWIDFSIPPEQRAEHTDAEIWAAWRDGQLSMHPEQAEQILAAYQAGVEMMSSW